MGARPKRGAQRRHPGRAGVRTPLPSTAVGRFVVIEGLDGAGKRTMADALAAELGSRGASVARAAFPRYDHDIHAALVRDALHGRLGDLADSVHGMAVLFALDRHGAAAELRAAKAGHDALLVDRYVASNAAYGAARLREDASGEFVKWVAALETERLGVPVPDLQLLLRVPRDLAAERAAHREDTEPDRSRDRFEADPALQQRTAELYEQLAATQWLSPWTVVDGTNRIDPAGLADQLLT
jgi:dTMP kinase